MNQNPATIGRSGGMSRRRVIDVLAAILIALTGTMLFLRGRDAPTDPGDQAWLTPVQIASSHSGLIGAVRLHQYQDTLVGVQSLRPGAAQILKLNRENSSWFAFQVAVSKQADGAGYFWDTVTFDALSGRFLLPSGYVENDRLVIKALTGSFSGHGVLQDTSELTYVTDKTELFGTNGPQVVLTRPTGSTNEPDRERIDVGRPALGDRAIYLPYSVSAYTPYEKEIRQMGETNFMKFHHFGPYDCGLVHSEDGGRSWARKALCGSKVSSPAFHQTTRYDYVLGQLYSTRKGGGLWARRKSIYGKEWDESEVIAANYSSRYGQYVAIGYTNELHVCWMDRRHDKLRFAIDTPIVENNDIYYRRRRDSDREWSNEVWLSKGLMYCYAPTMAVEGSNIVVAWAGIKKAGRWHTRMSSNDIYYAFSRNSGATWSAPAHVTDVARLGISSGEPEVKLLNGVIHLLYIQGATYEQAGPAVGLTKLGEGSWPIYYQQRPFPE